MGFAIAGAAIVGAGVSYYGATQQANAAQDAANAQKGAAANWTNFVQSSEQNAVSSLVGPTPAQLSAYGEALAAQERSVQRQETLAASLHPGLVAAGAQLNDLLQGKSAPVLSNLQNQRQLQRQNLLTQLKEQYGSGAESSTAGMQALSRFDSETSNILSNAQQSYIQQLSQVPLTGASLEQTLGQANAMLDKIQYDDPNAVYGREKAQAIMSFMSPAGAAQSANVNAAGGGSIGQALQGKADANLGSTLIQGAATYGGYSRSQSTGSQYGTMGNGYGSGQYGGNNYLGGQSLAASLGPSSQDTGNFNTAKMYGVSE